MLLPALLVVAGSGLFCANAAHGNQWAFQDLAGPSSHTARPPQRALTDVLLLTSLFAKDDLIPFWACLKLSIVEIQRL